MPKNVEIKAKLNNFNRTLHIVQDLCNSKEILLDQEDIFFKVTYGRLKLRNFQDGRTSELISYKREDFEGPKISDYSIVKVENNSDFLNVLKSSLGIIGIVKKKRYLFLYNQTRIHLDKVESLGDFLELEVVLQEGETAEIGEKVAFELLQKLEISREELISKAYIDLLLNI